MTEGMPEPVYSWDPFQLQAIVQWYGTTPLDPSLPPEDENVLAIDATSPPGQILLILQSLLDYTLSPKESASRLATSILAASDPTDAWAKWMGAVCSASEVHDQSTLLRLADMLVEISKLPHTLPRHPWGIPTENPEDLSFANLPGFEFQMRECFNGQ